MRTSTRSRRFSSRLLSLALFVLSSTIMYRRTCGAKFLSFRNMGSCGQIGFLFSNTKLFASFSLCRPFSSRRRPRPCTSDPHVDKSDSIEVHTNENKIASPFSSEYHSPVMWREVLEHLVTDTRGLYLDCTLGGGGHSEAILTRLEEPGGKVIALDQDPDALDFAGKRLEQEVGRGRFKALRANFRAATDVLLSEGLITPEAAAGTEPGPFSGILLDLGVSSHQLDVAARGFSFRGDGPLDMRMQGPMKPPTSTSSSSPPSALSAGDIVNTWEVGALSKVLRAYGEEPRAYKIARAIESSRPLKSTTELREVVAKCAPYAERPKVLARVFQGLRIAVNGEVEALEAILTQSTRLVRRGGRLVVLSYHSLEDRPVKRFLRAGNKEGRVERDFYGHEVSTWRAVARTSIRPKEDEVSMNPRARSVSMRVGERTELGEAQVRARVDALPTVTYTKPRQIPHMEKSESTIVSNNGDEMKARQEAGDRGDERRGRGKKGNADSEDSENEDNATQKTE